MINPSRHADNRNWLESLGRYIPGFKGYLDKEYRREADYLARKALADRLQRSKPALDSYMRNIVDAGSLDGLTLCERVRSRVDTLINTMRSDVRGYSGIFDYVKVKEDLLDQVYEHDMSLVDDVEAVGTSIDALSTSGESPNLVIPPILKQIEDIERLYAKRSDMLKGLAPEATA